jgi:hypothetical protein
MQWQHGSYTVFGNGTMILTPIAVDGRQLLSEPCRKKSGYYTRYNTTEEFKVYMFNSCPIRHFDLTVHSHSLWISTSTTRPNALN